MRALAQVAQPIAEGKVKVTVADLDRLIRLEEFLREEQESKGMEIILHWTDEHGNTIRDLGEIGGEVLWLSEDGLDIASGQVVGSLISGCG